MKPPHLFKVVADNAVVFHHFYMGLLLMIGSINYSTFQVHELNFWIGFLISLDDVVEHTITADTPLRILFDKVIAPRL